MTLGQLKKVISICLVVYWGMLFLGTHLPYDSLHHGVRINDKILHFIGFTGLSFLLAPVWMGRHPSAGRLLSVLVVLATYGAVDEWTQAFVPGRNCDFWDWCADVGGAIAGMMVYAAAVVVSRAALGSDSKSSGVASGASSELA